MKSNLDEIEKQIARNSEALSWMKLSLIAGLLGFISSLIGIIKVLEHSDSFPFIALGWLAVALSHLFRHQAKRIMRG